MKILKDGEATDQQPEEQEQVDIVLTLAHQNPYEVWRDVNKLRSEKTVIHWSVNNNPVPIQTASNAGILQMQLQMIFTAVVIYKGTVQERDQHAMQYSKLLQG